MTRILLALLVIAVWVALTCVAAWAMPQRDNDDTIDLAFDPHWNLNIPTDPVEPEKFPARPTTTTTVRTTVAPRRVVLPPTQGTRPVLAQPVRSYPPGVEQWRSLVAQYPWPVETMLAIMRCESGGNPLARNRSGASGLFQLLPGPPGWEDPATNIRLAYEMKYRPSGLSPWNASRGCW